MGIAEDYIHRLVEDLGYISVECESNDKIYRIANIISNALGCIYIMGNGGSASTAQHLAQGLMDAGVQAISLSDNVALITAISNDISYDKIFANQLENIIDVGDVLIAISGSGKSKNIVKALRFAQDYHDVRKIGLLGFDGGIARDLVDEYIIVPDNNYGRIEDVHLTLCHIISHLVKKKSR